MIREIKTKVQTTEKRKIRRKRGITKKWSSHEEALPSSLM